MTLPGETISNGAAPRCDDCGRMPKLDVYLSGGGYYIGTYCACGPYTRESGYYRHPGARPNPPRQRRLRPLNDNDESG